MWRIYSSGRFGVSHPREILVAWTQDELDNAHRVLDFLHKLESPT